jgi:ligand-binding sensor domain-containing protein
MYERFIKWSGFFGRTILLVVLFAAASSFVRAERLPVKTFTTADGLAQNAINLIVRDSRGFLWFCTDEGLSRFDGYSFTNYTTADGLPHPIVGSLSAGSRQSLF